MKSRAESLRAVAGRPFDLLVIGGGATGAGCALDGQLRGLRTALVDGGDFGGATSSASTKLAHGGVRYLEAAFRNFDFAQYHVVKRALIERRAMLDNAPFLVHQLPFVVPCYSSWDRLYYGAGLTMYDWLAGKHNLAPSRFQSVQQTTSQAPILAPVGLRGSVAYFDGQFDDARYAMMLVRSFTEAGGEALNYARVTGFEKDQSAHLVQAHIEDRLTGESFGISARAFLNASGPAADEVRRMANPAAAPRLRFSKGAHIVLPLPEGMGAAVVVPKTDDGRVIFAIPWEGRLLVGTTDDEVTRFEPMVVSREEANFLLAQLNRYTDHSFTRREIVSAFAGVRPLLRSDAQETRNIAREHEVENDPASGLISVLGGKWTTYRAMAEDGIDAVQRYLSQAVTPSRTRTYLLSGARDYDSSLASQLLDYGVSIDTATHLVNKFGGHARDVLAIARHNPELTQPLVNGFPAIRAEAAYCVAEEMAMSLEDVLARRTGVQFFSWKLAMEAAPATAHIMGDLLGWNESTIRNAVSEYLATIAAAMERIGLEPGAP